MQTTQSSLSTLLEIPEPWQLVPVQGKRPYQKGWNSKQYDRLEILTELESGKATGIGLKLGKGLLAIDIDGESADKLLKKLAGENDLSDFAKTTAWTSGRPGRKQCLFSVPEGDWHRLRTRRIGTGISGDDGKEECLEFRWLGHQSVLPPSIHPRIGKPYTWINNPLEIPPVSAPEWLIELCESWHSEYAGAEELDLVRFPARLFAHFGRHLSIWLLARRFDISRWSHGGQSKGSGIGKFTLAAASKILNRSQGHIRKLLCKAVRSGLLRKYTQHGDWITCYYTSFEKIIAIAGLEDIGPVAAVNIDDLSNLHILATEVEAQNLQRVSFYSKRQEEIKAQQALGKTQNQTRIIRPSDLLHPCGIPARVLAKGDRFLYCESDFAFYGGSQEGIGDRRGISVSTVGRHLSNRYRLEPAPVRNHRAGMTPIVKKQLAERLPLLKGMPPKLCREDGLFFAHSDWFKPRCNVYLLTYRLISCKRRRAKISGKIDNESLLFEAGSPKILDNNDSLYVLPSEDLEECLEVGQLLDRNLDSKIPVSKKQPGQ